MRHLRTFFICIIFIAFLSGVSPHGTWTTYKPFGEETKRVVTIAVNPDGTVWAGGTEGVARLDVETWTRFTEDNGLASNNALSIAIGSDGVVWVGGTWCVSQLDGEVWTTFTKDDGLVGSVVKLSLGKVLSAMPSIGEEDEYKKRVSSY